MKSFLSFVILLILTASILASDLLTGPVPGKYIVKFKKDIDPIGMAQSLGKDASLNKVTNLKIKSELIDSDFCSRVYTVHDNSQSLSEGNLIAIFGADNIEYIEPDYYIEFFEYPTDNHFPNQWYLHNTGQEYLGIDRISGTYNDQLIIKTGIIGKDINLSPLYENPPAENTRVVIAVVDTGVDVFHPELEGRIWRNPDEIPYNNMDDDHNGIVDDTIGYDVSGDVIEIFDPQGDIDPTDIIGHGTHIAGIIGANANGIGIVGIAPNVEIMPVKIRPNATVAVGTAGILYAVNSGAQIINVSWGSPFESTFLRDALRFARDNNVLVCIAAGNSGDNTRYYPAGYDSTFVIGAGNSDGLKTAFSTFGSHIDLIAPGLDILSLRADGTDMYGPYPSMEPDVRIIDDYYYLADGTSMAAPVVAGAAGLLLSVHPEISWETMEQVLKFGATDLVDPMDTGDFLPGPDTLSGYGYLNIDASLALLDGGSIFFSNIIRFNRYTSDIPIKIATVAGYIGGWKLEYAYGLGSDNWQVLGSGGSVPIDSLIYTFDEPDLNGFITFKLTDDFDNFSMITLKYVRSNHLEITSPEDGEDLDYNLPIIGSAYGPDYDSIVVTYNNLLDPTVWLSSSSGEFFDSLMYDWSISGSDTGYFLIKVDGYFSSGIISDSVTVHVTSTFSNGWPQNLGGYAGMTPVCADLNNDGVMEVIAPSSNGLLVFRGDNGQLVDGFPVYVGNDMRCVPAIYDVDGNGEKDIICTNESGIHIINYDGTNTVADALLECYTGRISYEYAFPNPTIARLRVESEPGAVPDSAILILNKIGEILAYRFDGFSYFFGLEGLFAQVTDRLSFSYGLAGGTSPFVTSANLNGDNLFEVVAGYTAPYPYAGLSLFNGSNGEPAFDLDDPTVLHIGNVHGTALADFDLDGYPEIITLGNTSEGTHMWVKTQGIDDYPGWPVAMPDVSTWISSYPIAADLDLDGIPEILCTFFEYDIASLYIFKADGTPYIVREGRPYGEAYSAPLAFGTPGVANLLGDDFPEIIIRSGYIFPGTGSEKIHILDYQANPVPGWPINTPARPHQVYSSRFVPLVDDIDNDGLVELVINSDAAVLMAWDFEASVDEGRNTFRFLGDNHNSGITKSDLYYTGINDERNNILPHTITLKQNYPNPFNPSTTISFSVPSKRQVKLVVYNILGQEVTTLADGEFIEGYHDIEFDGSDFASGIYLYRLQTGETSITRKMQYIK